MELHYLTFEIKAIKSSKLQYGFLVLRDKEGNQLKAYRATSGQINYQYPAASSIRGKGIIPAGDFKLYKGYPSSVPGVVDNKGRGYFFPIEGDNIKKVGRSSIGLHFDGGRNGSSTIGCIGLENPDSFQEIKNILLVYFKDNTWIELKVIYK